MTDVYFGCLAKPQFYLIVPVTNIHIYDVRTRVVYIYVYMHVKATIFGPLVAYHHYSPVNMHVRATIWGPSTCTHSNSREIQLSSAIFA